MLLVRHLSFLGLCFGVLLVPLAFAQDSKEDVLTKTSQDNRDITNLTRVSERTFVHEPTKVAYTIPEGWKEIRPHRLARNIDKRISTILGIEHGQRDMVASLYWIQMNPTQKIGEFVRDTPKSDNGEYGEEYETLKAVYGKDRVTVPTKLKHAQFEAYRIYIHGGPEKGEKYDGTLFVFEVDHDGQQWLVKARITFPKGDRTVNDQHAMDVLQGYSKAPEKIGPK